MRDSYVRNILLLIGAIILVSFLRVAPPSLTDLASGTVPGDTQVSWPLLRYVFEPVVGPAYYFLSFTRYILQLLSWLGWLALAFIIGGILRRQPVLRILKNTGWAWLILLSFAVFILLLPLPAPYLSLPKSYSAVDFHAHTYFSHDGLVTPRQSIAYHRNLGFDAFFDTEHGHTRGFPYFPEDYKFSMAYPGMQISTKDHISLVILADREFDGEAFRNRTVKEVIDLAHQNGFVVVCPHWWKWRQFTWQQLADLGIDGFEVYNAGYRNFPEAERAELVRFCQEHRLLMTASTDWHGWGSNSDIWTVLPVPQAKLDAKTLFEYLRSRAPVSILVYRRPERMTVTRYAFEPFFGIYYYFGSLTLKQMASWTGWLLLVGLLAARSDMKKVLRLLPVVLGCVFLVFAVYSLCLWGPVRAENQILYRLIAPVCAGMGIIWLLVGRSLVKTQ